MANTKELDEIEQIYRDTLKTADNTITKEKLKIQWGGEFEFDAVVREKGSIVEVHCLSVAKYKTRSGKPGNAKLFKVFRDAQMMLLIDCEKRILAFSDEGFYQKVLQEQEQGRFYPSPQIDIKLWNLRKAGEQQSVEIRQKIDAILEKASAEIKT